MLSVAFVARSVDPDFAEALRWHLAPFRRPDSDSNSFSIDLVHSEEDDATYSLLMGETAIYRSHRLGDVLGYALWAIHDMAPRRDEEHVLLHAGAVAREGQVLLLPARMESGKSSLVLALLEHGFSYLSDEVGALDPASARAYPFPKRITLDQEALRFFPGLEDRLSDRSGLSRLLPQRFARPEDVGAKVGQPGAVRWLVFPSDDWGGPARLSPFGRAEAVEAMAANCFNLYRHQDRGVLLLARIAKEAEPFRLDGGSPRERAALIAERLLPR
jgi:hypothetical protein